MLMLLYPLEGEIEGYPREQFLDDLCDEVEKDIRQAFAAGAERVSIDFTEGRLANKNDSRNPWTNKDMLQEFIDLNNRVIDRFSADERRNIGIHTCPGGDMDSVHSKEVPYEKLLSKMFQLNAGYFLIQCASEDDKESVYQLVGKYSRDDADGVPQVCFIGVVNPLDPEVETPEQVRDAAARGGEAHPGRAPRRDRRLRLLALQPRREAQARLARLRARHRDAEDRQPRQGRADGLRGAGRLSEPPDISLAASSAFVQGTGLEVDSFSGSEVTGHIDAGPGHHTPWGMVHGGVYASAVESACSIGASTAVDEAGQFAVGLSNQTDFLRAHREGRLDVRAVPVHQGRTGQLWHCDITREDGKLVAQGRVRLQNVPRP